MQRPNRIGDRLEGRRPPNGRPRADGRLLLLAANHHRHPVSGRLIPRRELLGRIAAALSVADVDGVLASADILEELTLLNLLEGRMAWCSLQGDSAIPGSRPLGPPLPASIAIRDRWDGIQATVRFVQRRNGAWEVAGSRGGFASRSGPLEELPRLIHLLVESEIDPADPKATWSSALPALAGGLANGRGIFVSMPVTPALPTAAEQTGVPLLLRDTPVPIPVDAWENLWGAGLPLTVRGFILGASALFPADDDVAVATESITRSALSL